MCTWIATRVQCQPALNMLPALGYHPCPCPCHHLCPCSCHHPYQHHDLSKGSLYHHRPCPPHHCRRPRPLILQPLHHWQHPLLSNTHICHFFQLEFCLSLHLASRPKWKCVKSSWPQVPQVKMHFAKWCTFLMHTGQAVVGWSEQNVWWIEEVFSLLVGTASTFVKLNEPATMLSQHTECPLKLLIEFVYGFATLDTYGQFCHVGHFWHSGYLWTFLGTLGTFRHSRLFWALWALLHTFLLIGHVWAEFPNLPRVPRVPRVPRWPKSAQSAK